MLWPPLRSARLPPATADATAGEGADDPVRRWPLACVYHLWRLISGPFELLAGAQSVSSRLGYTPPILLLPRSAPAAAPTATTPVAGGAATTAFPHKSYRAAAAAATALGLSEDGTSHEALENVGAEAAALYSGGITAIDLDPLRRRLAQPPEPLR